MGRSRVSQVFVAASLIGASTLCLVPAAEAAERNGKCEPNEFCYYYNSNNQGSVSDFTSSIPDYGESQPTCYEFKGPGAGQYQCIKNEAASARNLTANTVRVYYNSGYGGAFQDFPPGSQGNLTGALYNENASHEFRQSGTPPLTPQYRLAYDYGFGPLRSGHTRTPSMTMPKTGDDGLVVFRWFIPSHHAGHGTLLGDNRGPSSDPLASRRATYTWDVGTGRATLDVSPTTLRLTGSSFDAYPTKVWPSPMGVQVYADQPMKYNSVHARGPVSGPTAYSEVWFSLANSVTGGVSVAALTIDGSLKIQRRASGGYNWLYFGNGMPALEGTYYPRYDTAQPAQFLGWRSVEPAAQSVPWARLIDAAGGAALFNEYSNISCGLSGARALHCKENLDAFGSGYQWTTTW